MIGKSDGNIWLYLCYSAWEGCFFYLMVWVFVMLDDLITLIYLWLLFHRKAGFGCCVSDKSGILFCFFMLFLLLILPEELVYNFRDEQGMEQKDIADSATQRERPKRQTLNLRWQGISFEGIGYFIKDGNLYLCLWIFSHLFGSVFGGYLNVLFWLWTGNIADSCFYGILPVDLAIALTGVALF